MASFTCPVDGTVLVPVERSGIEIDHCPACRGVWLDRGELDKIIERNAAPSPAPAPQPQYGGDRPRYDDRSHGHGNHYPHKRRKSFLEELFD
jgi:Zn-finger nucleic acid-binding protein